MKIGLYFGSFNPVHNGHLAIANYFLEFTDIDKIWFVVSPQNPFKNKNSLLNEYHRLELINLAIDDFPNFYASNIEFNLPKPSYTIDTLTYLKEKYKKKTFVLIMGGDNLVSIHKWKNYKQIVNLTELYIYPRPSFDSKKFNKLYNITIVNAPLMEISSSFIRKAIKNNKDVRFFLHKNTYDYIKEMNFYK